MQENNSLQACAQPLADIREVLEQISGLRDRPAGRVRLHVPRLAAMRVLAPKLGQFARDYADVVLDVTAPSTLLRAGSTQDSFWRVY